MNVEASIARRSRIHSALAEPYRLRIVDELAISDLTPTELARSLDIGSNLLAHHLAILEAAGLIVRRSSEGDARRRYVQLDPQALSVIAAPVETLAVRNALFVCRANSARSQFAAAAWNARHSVPASSAGTHPAERVRDEAIEAAANAGLDLTDASPRSIDELSEVPDLVVTVCDVANEELPRLAEGVRLLHWSVPDPVRDPSPSAFDLALQRISRRIEHLAPWVRLAVGRRS